MKKLATFVLLGAFTMGSIVGCGGKDAEKKEGENKDAPAKAPADAPEGEADSGSGS